MACPHFEPVRHRAEAGTILPLRDFWFGVCRAEPPGFEPNEQLLSECCNMGYARGKCPRFPAAEGPDAVRFCIARDEDRKIVVNFAIERDHHPHMQGSLEFFRGAGVADPGSASLLEKQAGAYVAGYLRRRPSPA